MTAKGEPGIRLPPGFRFHPTDDELISYYLCRKCADLPISVPVIQEIDLYKFDPWQLPEMACYGEKEWYFFSHRDRKYPNGSRPNRSAGTGFWKATGADKPIGQPRTLGIKKSLVFYAGKAPQGVKTNWIMHEYRLCSTDRSASFKRGRKLDDWVLCRIYNKKGSSDLRLVSEEKAHPRRSVSDIYQGTPPVDHERFRGMNTYGCNTSCAAGALGETSSSEQVDSPDEEVVQSEPEWNAELENALAMDFMFLNGPQELLRMDNIQEMLMLLQKPL